MAAFYSAVAERMATHTRKEGDEEGEKEEDGEVLSRGWCGCLGGPSRKGKSRIAPARK